MADGFRYWQQEGKGDSWWREDGEKRQNVSMHCVISYSTGQS